MRTNNNNNNMGYYCCSQYLKLILMIMIISIIFILFFSFNTTTIAHISSQTRPPLSPETFAAVNDGNAGPNQLFFVRNLRVLLGVNTFLFSATAVSRSRKNYNHLDNVSPSPSPSPSPALAPVPHLRVTAPRPERHAFHALPRPREVRVGGRGGDGRRGKKVLAAVLASVGGVAAFVALVSLLLAFRRKRGMNAPKKRRSDRSNKRVSSHRPDSKPSLNPGLDHFYLDSLSKDLELQDETPVRHPTKPEFGQVDLDHRENSTNSAGAREITSVHEHKTVIPVEEPRPSENVDEDDDDDDQSFHSLVESNSSSSNAVNRLSNASFGSFSDALESFNSNELTQTFSPPPTTNAITVSTLPPPPPPPPPPPLPPPRVNFLPARSKALSSSSSTSTSCALQSKSAQLNEHFASSPANIVCTSKASPSSGPSGVPQPPPAPPFKAGVGAAPPPPPPQLPPMGKDGSPLPKLKPLHWDKVRAAPNQSMVWDKLRSSSFELDEVMIESLFGYNLRTNTLRNDETKSKTPSPSKNVLEPKRLQNITILSKALNLTSDQVCEAILKGNGLSLQQLEALVKMVPTKEEEAKLLEFKGDTSELGSAERFVKAVISIPMAFQRVEAMLYRETFEDEVIHLTNSFSMLEEACKELRSSRLFLKLLEAVLKTGNRMNVGTIRGGARAFKLDALLKLADVKGTDGKTSLLHFVVQEIIRSEGIRVSDSIMGRIQQKTRQQPPSPSSSEEDYKRMGLDLVSGLSTELYNVKKTAAVDLDVLATSVSGLAAGLEKLRRLVEDDVAADERSVRFVGHAERRLEELRVEEEKVMARVREVTEYFHGNSNNNNIISINKNNNSNKEEANPLRIFVIVRDFLCMLDHVCKELRGSHSKARTPRSPNPLAPFR